VWDEEGATWDSGAVYASDPDPADVARVLRRGMRRRITPDHLARVVELHDKGGVGAVINEMGGDERTVRRWLARAREAGLR
jgi:hypothetical protein